MSSSPGAAPARGPMAGGRVGLSEYTAQRLAELRARRAEAESTDVTVTFSKPPALAPAPAPRPSPTTSRTASLATADCRPAPATVTPNSASDLSVNGLQTHDTSTATSTVTAGVNRYNSYRTTTDAASHSPQAQTTVSSPHHQHHQHQQYVSASTGRTASYSVGSSSVSRPTRESSGTVDMITTHQVTI